MKMKALENFCYSCIIDGCGEDKPMTVEDAEYNLENWIEEGDEEIVSVIRNVDARDFAKVYNRVLAELTGGKMA